MNAPKQSNQVGKIILQWGTPLAALGIALWAAWSAQESAREAKEANARASGRIPAKLVLEDVIPNSDTLPREMRANIFGLPLTTVYFRNVKMLADLNTRIVLKNIGEEPVDTIRVTVTYRKESGFSLADKVKRPDDLGPISTEQVHRDDHVLDKKMNKGDVAIIPVTKGLLSQMLQAQKGQKIPGERYGEFGIQCYGKPVGATSFDDLSDEKMVTLRALWWPTNFDTAECKKIIEEFRPRVEVMRQAAVGER